MVWHLAPLRGSFQLSFEGESTSPLPSDADSATVKNALETLKSIGTVHVTRFENNNGYNYFITFASEFGDLEQIEVDYSQLTGPDAKARVATIQDGKFPCHGMRA